MPPNHCSKGVCHGQEPRAEVAACRFHEATSTSCMWDCRLRVAPGRTQAWAWCTGKGANKAGRQRRRGIQVASLARIIVKQGPLPGRRGTRWIQPQPWGVPSRKQWIRTAVTNREVQEVQTATVPCAGGRHQSRPSRKPRRSIHRRQQPWQKPRSPRQKQPAPQTSKATKQKPSRGVIHAFRAHQSIMMAEGQGSGSGGARE